ncbi:MAG: hypothetical protein ABEJ98_04815 [Candidatus Nanohaloarchaea archaeon]
MGIFGQLYTFYRFRVRSYLSSLPGAFWLNRHLAGINNYFVDSPGGDEFKPVEKDWDVLIVLDACRYDYYKEFYPSSGKRVSSASHSREYFRENFSSGDFKDTIYISANPHISPERFAESTDRDLSDVFFEVHHLTLDKWDNELGVVPPEALTEKALEQEERYPGKRKIIHFMQPHGPYIQEEKFDGISEVVKGEAEIADLRDAYIKNIESVLPEVERLKEKLNGRVVITGDHGELLGEYGMFSHPYGLKAKELREVPWHVIKDEKKDFVEYERELNNVDF